MTPEEKTEIIVRGERAKNAPHYVYLRFECDGREYMRMERLHFIPAIGMVFVGFDCELHVKDVSFLLNEHVWCADCLLHARINGDDLENWWEPE